MAKFKMIRLSRSNKAGETYSEQFEIRVDGKGQFYTCPSEDVLKAARSLPERVSISQPRRNARWRIASETYAELVSLLAAAIDELLAEEVSTERVIVYGCEVNTALWRNADGTLHANGYIGADAAGSDGGGGWCEHGPAFQGSRRGSCFDIGLRAFVFDRITYSHPNSERVVFEQPDWGHSHLEHPTWGAKLNGFVFQVPSDPGTLESMPYTEEAAKFFYDTLIGLAGVGLRLRDFFADQTRVQQAIQFDAVPQLTIGAGRNKESESGKRLPDRGGTGHTAQG